MKKILHFAAALLLALPAVQAQTLSGSLTTSSPLSAGVDGGALSYYFEAYTFEVTVPGTYTFLASADFDSYGQLYAGDSIYFGYPSYNLILYNDDSIGVDFGFQYHFAPGTYTLVVTAFSAMRTGTYTVTATGPAPLNFTSPVLLAGDPGAPLPLTLLYFSAQKQDNNSAMLQWSTVSEMNVSHFEVEKSTDGKNYNSIGRVAATGNDHACEHAYTLTDPALSAGINTYRLKMVDEDGTFTYSKVALLNGMAQQMTTVSLYPNPASAITMLSMTAVTPSTMRVIVADQIGRAVLSQQYNVEVGRNDQPLDISALTPGAYTLQWWAGEETGTLKLMKNKQ